MKPIRPIHDSKTNYVRVLDRIHDILNGAISFGHVSGYNGVIQNGNTDAVHVQITFVTTNVAVTVIHGLNRIPTGYKVVRMSNPGQIYDGAGAGTFTKTQLTLACSFSASAPTAILLVY